MNWFVELFSAALVLMGAGLSLIAAIGIVRMPDLYTRMQASSKAGTLGVGCIVLAVPTHFSSLALAAEAILITLFIVMTAPVAAHLIARAAYFVDVPTWKQTVYDELRGCYNRESHKLHNASPLPMVRPEREPTAIGTGGDD